MNERLIVDLCCGRDGPAVAWLCVEYADEDFQRLAGPGGFEYYYGTTIMGISVAESAVREYLKMPFLQKDVLASALEDSLLRCWWFCDADFEGMSMWHKDYAGESLGS